VRLQEGMAQFGAKPTSWKADPSEWREVHRKMRMGPW
jgi:hypothetical protein